MMILPEFEFYLFDQVGWEVQPNRVAVVLDALEADHEYLTEGGVFPEELLKNFIKTKRAECAELSKIPHPAEFEKYYNL